MKNEYKFEDLKENMMGPNCIRILDELSRDFKLRANDRVLDLGCGTGMTSIFLAQEFGVQVYATDLWISATDNYRRFQQSGLDGRIIPIHADAAALPYAEEFFDAIISIDAYSFFGGREGFVDQHLAPLIRKDGFIAVATAGLLNDFEEVPTELEPYWQENMNFYSKQWWGSLWDRESSISLTHCKSMSCHQKAWEDWLQCDNPYAIRDIEMMKAEAGKYFDTIELIAVKK